jgi:threonine/homoserine/homoserine lactone efflux protein
MWLGWSLWRSWWRNQEEVRRGRGASWLQRRKSTIKLEEPHRVFFCLIINVSFIFFVIILRATSTGQREAQSAWRSGK